MYYILTGRILILSKKIEVSAGHRLHLHRGGCSNLHGHNYRIHVEIFFKEATSFIDGVGYYIDFSKIKKLVGEYMDHQFLVSDKDPLVDSLKSFPGVKIVNYSPTAENIAIALQDLVVKALSGHTSFDFVRIKIKETGNSEISVLWKY